MGFSCFACSESFEESGRSSEKGGGDGHRETPARSVSVVAKCGHMFHSDCLKKAFDAQSGNAWVPKHCPVCHITVTLHDVLRVHANPHDAHSSQRPRMEELIMEVKKLQKERESVYKQCDMLQAQCREMNYENGAIKRQKDELGLRFEHLGRLNSIHKADIERFKSEIEKLKNIIITLTERITGHDITMQDFYGTPGNNGMNVGGMCRLEYTEELQRIPGCDSSSSMSQMIMNGSLPKPSHHHPPGFMYPMGLVTENGSDCQESDTGSQNLSVSPEIPRSSEIMGGALHMNGSTVRPMPTENQNQQARITCFSLQNVQVRDYDSNNNRTMGMKMIDDKTVKKSSDFSSKENVPASFASKLYSALAGNSSVGKSENPNSFEHKKVEKAADDYVENDDDAVDKWFEKKARRRTSSKGSGTGNRGDKNGSKTDLSDKKLLYGSFLCSTCHAKWGSSQSVLNSPQTCRYCHTEVYPHTQGPILSRKQLEMNKLPSNTSPKDATKDKKKA